MILEFADRESDSPFVERIWRSSSRQGGSFLSMAEGSIELVVTRLPGFLAVTLRGPVSRASSVECPPHGEWLAIRFRLGTYLPRIPDAGMKIAVLDVVTRATAALGYPDSPGFIRGLGASALACTMLYAVPRTAMLGAILLTAYLGGAVASHVRIGSPLFSHILFGVYLAILAWGGIFLRDARIRALLPLVGP